MRQSKHAHQVAIAVTAMTLSAQLWTAAWAAGPASGATAAPANKAAQLLSASEAQRVLGGEVVADGDNGIADTKNGPTAYISKAGFELKGNNPIPPKITLFIRHQASKEEAKLGFDAARTSFKGTDVTSLGSPAFRSSNPPQLNILKGVNWLTITAGTVKQPDQSGQERIAKEVLPKIID